MEWDGVSKLEMQENSSFFESGITNNMFSVDLKLGMLEHMNDVPMETLKSSMGLAMPACSASASASASASGLTLSKRGRPRNNGQQNTVTCMVDGCTSDLSQCREYHRRHRVCERHSKTPVVPIQGKEMRFCQQCSRFHALGEFDDSKRSCRKRLDGHNRRRRKTQPENLYLVNTGGFQSPSTGNGLLQFCGTSNRPAISEPEKTLYNSRNQNLHSSPNSFLWNTNINKGDKPLSFMNQQTSYQPFSNAMASAGNLNNGRKASPDRLIELGNSECALSLLSRYPTQSSGISGVAVRPPITMSSSAQVNNSPLHLNYSLAQFSFSQGILDESSASIPITTNNSHILGGFQSGQDSLSENGPRNFPFSWQ